MITRPVLSPSAFEVEDKGALDDMVSRRRTATAGHTIYVEGRAKTCAPRIGRLLSIQIPENISDSGELGTYRIVKVKHVIDENHRYYCEFEGIPASLKYMPTPSVHKPVVSSVTAMVVKNDDPDNLGRVRVEFPFVPDKPSFAWLRVMSPDAGGLAGATSSKTGNVEKNRGLVFIPEEGDQVMVGFEFGDPNRPYVMGSMFHGKNAAGGGENNHIKSIVTRSGIKIVFNDDQKSLHIEDPSGSTWDMDGKGSIYVNAPETIDLTAKNINLNADENILVSAKRDVTEIAGENLSIQSKNRTEQVEEQISIDIQQNTVLNIGGNNTITVSNDVNLTAGKIIIEATDSDLFVSATGKITLKSGDIVDIAQ